MRTNLLGEPLGLTYRQLKIRQTLYKLVIALFLIIGFLVVAHEDYQYLTQ